MLAKPDPETAERIRGTDDDGVANLIRRVQGLVDGVNGDGLGDGDVDLLQGLGEEVSVLAELEGPDTGAQNSDAVLLQGSLLLELYTQVEGGLTTETEENTIRPLLLDDILDVLVRNGL